MKPFNAMRLRKSGVTPINPSALFASGEKGFWYEPSDFSTMFQDIAGTTPVTTTGQTVGKILDKSGNGLHAAATTNAKRPTLQQDGAGFYYLQFDGTDDCLVTASVALTASDKVSTWLGLYYTSIADAKILVEYGPIANTTNGTFALLYPDSTVARMSTYLRGTAILFPFSARAINTKFVDSVNFDINGTNKIVSRKNATSDFTSTSTAGSGNFSTQVFNIGGRNNAANFYAGRLYSAIVRGAASSAAQIEGVEAYVNSLTGAY